MKERRDSEITKVEMRVIEKVVSSGDRGNKTGSREVVQKRRYSLKESPSEMSPEEFNDKYAGDSGSNLW